MSGDERTDEGTGTDAPGREGSGSGSEDPHEEPDTAKGNDDTEPDTGTDTDTDTEPETDTDASDGGKEDREETKGTESKGTDETNPGSDSGGTTAAGSGAGSSDPGPSAPSLGGTDRKTETENEGSRLRSSLSTLGGYLADHTVHLAVIALLGLYPGIHFIAANIFPPAELILPPVHAMVAVFYFGLFAMSFDFISGYTGYLSLGHAAFYGIGAYSVLMVANGLIPFIPPDTWFMITVIVAGLVSVFFAIIIGLVSFRLRGFYFAMITLGFTQVMYVFMTRWRYPVAEGRDPSFGISANPDVGPFELGIPYVDVVSLDLSGNMLAIGRIQGDTVSSLFGTGIGLSAESVSYYMIGIIVLLCYFIMQRIIHSPFGSVLIAIRENEERARAIGYNVFAYKIAAFSISAFFAAVAGGLFAGYQRAVSPEETFFFMRSADAILATVIGGFGTLAGPLYGRTLQGVVENFLNEAPFIPGFLEGQDILFLGIAFIIFVLYLPTGIVGAVRSRAGGKLSEVMGEKISHYFSNF